MRIMNQMSSSRAEQEDNEQEDNGPDVIQHEDNEPDVIQQMQEPAPMLEGVLTNNQEPNVDRSRKWSSWHKPTSRLRGYMEFLMSVSCLGEFLHQEDQTFFSTWKTLSASLAHSQIQCTMTKPWLHMTATSSGRP